MAKGKLLADLTTKKIYEGDSEDQLIHLFTDYLSGSNSDKKNKIKGKAVLNNAISSLLFEYLESYHVMTHFISKLSDRETLVKNMPMLPISITVTNTATADLSKRYGFEKGTDLENPVTEVHLQDEKRKNPLVNQSHLLALKIAKRDEILSINRIIHKVNAVLKSFFERRDIQLVQFTLKFGRIKGHMVVGDEMSPDVYQLMDLSTNQRLDMKGADLKSVKPDQFYQMIHDRIMGE